MKKRVLSLVLAFVLSFSMMPMSAFAEETGTVTEQETQKGENSAEVSTTGEDTAEVSATGEDISSGNAVTKDAAVEAAQALIDALPEKVTAENADELQTQLMAIAEAMEALNEEQTAKLNMTRLENIQAALNGAVAVQEDEHDHNKMESWNKQDSLPNEGENKSYYLDTDVTLTQTWTPANGTVLCLNGHSITMKERAAVITIESGVTFTLYDCDKSGNGNGKITHGTNDNNIKYYGHGVEVKGGTFYMYGGIISNNTSSNGAAGVYLAENATFTMTGGTISDNSAADLLYGGGGVYLAENATFTMQGGEISGNTGGYGGGVAVREKNATFTMQGGKISGNTAAHTAGGGVDLDGENTTFNMAGGEITGNKTTGTLGSGCGVNVSASSSITVAGNVKIKDNTDKDGNSNNVYLEDNRGISAIITVTGKLTDEAHIGVTTQVEPTEDSPVTLATAGEGYALTADDAAHFSGDANEDYYPVLTEGVVKLYPAKPHMHLICGETCNHAGDEKHTETLIWKGISSLSDITGPGNYYLTANITSPGDFPGYDVNLCLNGYKITYLELKGGAKKYALCDCSAKKAGEISGGTGCGIVIRDNSIDMYGGTITREKMGVWMLSDKSQFNMYGGSITGNATSVPGYMAGGVEVEYGTFNMYGGSITKNNLLYNVVDGKAGGVYVGDGIFNMYGDAVISGNKVKFSTGGNAYGAAGVYVENGTFNMTGNAKISNNTLTVSTSLSTSDSMDTYAGGVSVKKGVLTVGDSAQITGNTKSDNSNNVNLLADQTIAIGSELTKDAKIGVTTATSLEEGDYVPIAEGTDNCNKLTEVDSNAFSSDDGGYTANLKNNTVIFVNGELHEHAICGAETCSDNHASEKWKPITNLNEITVGGNYYLKDNVTLESTWDCTVAGVKLCLNGHTITGAYGSPVIQVRKRGSLDITDCKTEAGQITHESEVSGRGIMVQGTLTLWNGDITGNTDGGVYVKSGTFTMNSGSITGNMGSSYGGVYVYNGATFNMNGGTINGNNCKKSDGSGGGVYVYSGAKFTVSGAAKIINNWRSGELANNVYVQGNGTKGNVFLYSDATITVGEEGLTDEARIGVCKSQISLPKAGKTVKIATGASESLKYTEIFALDIDDPNYSIVSDDGGNLFIHLHKHSWRYKVSDDATITATCGAENCLTKDGGSVTISKPEHTTYGDGKKADATLVENGWVADTVTITYKDKDDVVLEGAPTDAGEYTASITLGDATASVTYEIEKATPSADDFTFTAPSGGLIYDGNAQPAKVDVNGDIKGIMGEIVAVKYYQDEKEVQEPINAGTYKVKIDVTAGINYKAVNSLTSDDWTFTIERNPNAPVVVLNDGTSYTYTGEPIQPAVTVTVGGKELENGKDYTVTYDGNVNVGDGTVIITAKGNYAFAKDTEHFTIVQAKQTLNFEKDAVNTTYGDAPFTNALAKTSTYFGTITYSSDNTAVATVDGSTGQVTIVGVGTATITATAAATTNYKEGSASYTLTVNKALLVVNGAPVVQDKYYDGTADAVVTVSFADGNNALLKLKPTTDYTVTGTFSSPNASTSKQEVSIKIELKGDYAKNYELKEDTYTAYAYINAKPISIVSATAVGREYVKDNRSVTISSVEFDDVVTSLVKDTDYTVTGEMADADAGTNKEVTVKVTLSGDAATNYNLSDTMPTTTVDISQATAEIAGATTQRIMKNGVEVDISKWVSFNNTDSKAELEYELLYSPAGITLNGSKLTAANNDTTVESFAIKVTAKETPNFTSAEKTITVDVVDKMPVGIIFKEPVKSNTVYGDPDFSLTADFDPKGTVPAKDDNGTWEWKSSNPDVLEIISGGDTTTPTIKVLKAGRSFLTVTYTSDTYSGGPNGVSITVNPKAITADMIGNIDAQEYTGKDIKPTPEVKDGTTKLTNDTDFEYSYSNNTNAGTATLTITGKGNYEGEVTKKFTISPKSIDGVSIELANKSFAYTGSEQTVNITSVKLSDGTILGTDDYVIKDNSNKATNAGEITLTIEGKGNYTGTATTTWAITKAVPKLADFDVVPDLRNELTYSGEEQIVNVTTKAGIRGMGMITVRYNDSTEKPVNVGSYAITIDVADGSNYKAISGIEAGTLTIKKAAAPTLADVKVDHAYATTGNQTVSLAELVKSAKSYTPGEITGNTETEILSDINVTGDGVLQYTLTGKGAAGSTVTIPVAIISTNYEETTVNVVITIKQATPTGAPGYDFIHDSSKTLKDAGLDLINSTLNPKEGTLEWIDSNGKVLPGETKLEEGKKYIWRFTPDDPNYAVITGEVELYAPYRILDGADSTWTQSTDGTISIRGNGDFEKFQSVKVDGVVVDAKNYTVAKGSTIITFKGDYLKTLSTGSHTFELVWTDGSATTKFTIAAKADNGDNNNSDNNNNDKNDDSDNDTVVIGNVSSGNNTVPAVIGAPKTGDASGIWMTLFAVSLAGLAAMLVRKKNNLE